MSRIIITITAIAISGLASAAALAGPGNSNARGGGLPAMSDLSGGPQSSTTVCKCTGICQYVSGGIGHDYYYDAKMTAAFSSQQCKEKIEAQCMGAFHSAYVSSKCDPIVP